MKTPGTLIIAARRVALQFFLVTVLALVSFAGGGMMNESRAADRPNILWITYEDSSGNLGCYGDDYAITPNIDRLAAEGVRYTHAFATSGVCAPARSCLITGVYPSSMGTQFMRCMGTLPSFIRCYPEYLRDAGYYCTNSAKTDYNFKPAGEVWDESSGQAHWRRRPNAETPFFAVFNLTVTHESKTSARGKSYDALTASLTPDQRRDPAKAILPPYYPDTPEARRDWANNAELITVMDQQAGELLRQLDEDGLADDTIVFVYSDHGVGLPRAKRWVYDSGIHVPLVIRFPEKYRDLAPGPPGTVTDRLVSFVDFAPTVLSLAGAEIPAHMQGQAFLGSQADPPRDHIYAIRDRMDERYDVIRAVRDHRYKYIRNYMPHMPYAQYLNTPEKGPTMQSIRRLEAAGELEGPAALFVRPTKPPEELFDTWSDPHEIHNLAGLRRHQELLEKMRRVHAEWVEETIDVGLLPEPDLRRRSADTTAYEMARRTDIPYPREAIRKAAELTQEGLAAMPQFKKNLFHDDPAVRYWAAVGLIILGPEAQAATEPLERALEDPSPSVRTAAAHALANVGRDGLAVPVLIETLRNEDEWVRLGSAIALDSIGEAARPALGPMTEARDGDKNKYVARVVNHAINGLLGTDHKVR